MDALIPDDTWTLSPGEIHQDGLFHRVLSAPDGRTALRLSAHPSADKPAPFRILAAAHTIQAVGGTLVPETRWTELSLQAWGDPSVLFEDATTRAFIAAVLAGQAARPSDMVLVETLLSAWGHLRGQSSWAGGKMLVFAEADLRKARYSLKLLRRERIRETVAQGEIRLSPALVAALSPRAHLLRAHVEISVLHPKDTASAHARLAHEVEVLEPLRQSLLAQAQGSGSNLAPLMLPILNRILKQLRI